MIKMGPENKNKENWVDMEIWKEFSLVYRILYKDLEKFLSDYGLGVIEFRVLKALNEFETLPMVKLSEINSITQPWITEIVDRLEKRGLVQRIRSSEDRRIINILLNKEGKDLYCKVNGNYENNISAFLSCLKEGRKEQFLEVLGEIRKDFDVTLKSKQ
ncbi:MarR family transcriptional regulator [mine drainage metagenome]|uniref:MarR family transcriptional regulator n=1 Tax=mine drainage metagenome TaxID=410659 RepID=T0YNN4_9ZZZZ